MNMEARQLPTFTYPSTRKLSVRAAANETELCVSAITNDVQFLTNVQWHVGQEIKHVVFQEIFAIPSYKLV
jgi:hypothetical protein